MNKLKGACCYLSGPMEMAIDNGIFWRRKFIDLACSKGLDIDFIDPTNKPGKEEMKIEEDKKHQINLQKEGNYKELQKYVKKYRRFDLRFVDISDFLIAFIDPTLHMCGTYNEIFVAEQQKKPCFFICEEGLKKLPRWLFGVIDLNDPVKQTRCNVFENMEDLIEELVMLNNGIIELNQKWVLIRKHIEEIRNRSRIR
jgi:nucleoside 2-deoxyribosyltransferase